MLRLIAVPYHLGRKSIAVGAGPSRVIDTGIASRIGAGSVSIDIGPQGSWQEVNTALTNAVRSAREAGCFPLLLAGNCNSCLGTLAAIQHPEAGIVWFDAHGDFHTQETTISGSLEGMSLALATSFVAENRIVLAGGWNLDPGEAKRVKSRLLHIPSADLDSAALPDMHSAYVHVDIDVLDPGGGVSAEDLFTALRRSFERYRVAALAITNYNPERDQQNRTRDIIVSIIEHVHGLRRSNTSR